MDTREAMNARREKREQDLAVLKHPREAWPLHPFLPLARRDGAGKPELGIMFDSPEHGVQPTVFLANVCDIGGKIRNEAELKGEPCIHYGSLEGILASGWEVD